MKRATDGRSRPAAGRSRPAAGPDERPSPALPPNYLRACLQLLLMEGSAHGYQLAEQLGELGLDAADRGGVYRVLRAMEDEGLVSSWWEASAGTPPKRTYQMTAEGLARLCDGAEALRQGLVHVSDFLARFNNAEDPSGVAA